MKLLAVQKVRFLRALTVRPFALLWLGQTISALGDGAFNMALAWAVLLLTHSAAAMGIVVTAEILPRLVFLIFGGVLADRWSRRSIMLLSDAGRGVVVLLIAALGWLHLLQFWHIIVLSLLFGTAAGFFMPAYRAIPPQLVETELLPSANALTSLSQQCTLLLGPLLGAGLVALSGPVSAFAFDGLTFLISACCLFFVDVSLKVKVARSDGVGIKNILEDLRAGWRFVIGARWFWIGLPIATLGNIFFSGTLDVALPKLVHDVYGQDVWLLGVLSIALAVGSIVATLVVGQMSRIPRRGILAYVAVAVASIGQAIMGLPLAHSVEPLVACIANGLLGFGLGAFGIIWVTIMQELVPEDMLGRVSSIDQLGAWGLLPVGFLLAGVATDHMGAGLVFLCAGAANLVLAIIALAIPDIRKLA